MTRAFRTADELRDLVADRFGSDRRPAALDRLSGGTKKGVYRLRLDDGHTVIVYVWADDENYWPSVRSIADDPFTDATGAELFAFSHAALVGARVPVPELLLLDRDGRWLDADLALVEDAGGETLEALMARDPAAAAAPLAELGEALRRMHTTTGPRYGKVAEIARDAGSPQRFAADVIVDRALLQLELATALDTRLAAAHQQITDHVRTLRADVPDRREYALVHGELGPDHVFVTPAGSPMLIDIEGLTYFDVEWEHAWLEMRFRADYPALRPVPVDPARLALYRYAQVLSLIEGPLRIAGTDFPNRQWMFDLAQWNITKALAAVSR
jgi:aminoglycoside phosphotransferase (APT) family kinase protein